MDIIIALAFFGIGLGLIIFFAEQLVKGVVGTSMGFGLSTFLLSVIFIGFDPDNLAVALAFGMPGHRLASHAPPTRPLVRGGVRRGHHEGDGATLDSAAC